AAYSLDIELVDALPARNEVARRIDMRAGVNGRRDTGDVHTAVFMTNAAFDADRREELLREHAVAVRLRKVNQSHGAHLRKVERQALPPRWLQEPISALGPPGHVRPSAPPSRRRPPAAFGSLRCGRCSC